MDPVSYFKRYAGRFPLLHIKDLKKGFKGSTTDTIPLTPPNFLCCPWARAASIGTGCLPMRVRLARSTSSRRTGATGRPLESVKISFDYLKNLRLA